VTENYVAAEHWPKNLLAKKIAQNQINAEQN